MNGFALGGAAEGFSRAEQNQLARDTLGLQERQFKADQHRSLTAEADNAIGNTLKVVSQAIEQAKAAGAPPEKIRKLIAPLMKDVNEIAQGAGRDPSRFTNAVEAQINTPVQTEPSADEKIVEQVRQEALKQKLREDAGLAEKKPKAGEGGEQLFGVDVPPVVSDINAFDAPVQKAFFKAQDKATKTAQLLDELEIFKRLIETAQTGKITEVTLPMAQFFEEAGIKLRDDVPALEAIQAAQNQLALRLRNPDSGFGLTGSTSDRDVKFLKDAVGGIQNTPEGNRAAVIVQIAKMRREADLSALKAELMGRGAPQLFEKIKKQFIQQTPLFTPEEESFLSALGGKGEGERTIDIEGNIVR